MKTHTMRALLPIMFAALSLSLPAKLYPEVPESELAAFTVYGRTFMAAVTLPYTWTANMDLAREMRMNGFFYPKAYRIGDAPAAILLTLAGKQNAETKFGDWVSREVDLFLKSSGGFTAREGDWKITNKNGYTIKVFGFQNPGADFTQYSAYLDAGLDYFVNLSVVIYDENITDEVLSDFTVCLENSTFLGIGFHVE